MIPKKILARIKTRVLTRTKSGPKHKNDFLLCVVFLSFFDFHEKLFAFLFCSTSCFLDLFVEEVLTLKSLLVRPSKLLLDLPGFLLRGTLL